jgi:hypothetical protein
MFCREAGGALALVESGKNHSDILDWNQSSKFPLLLKYCSLGGVKHLLGDDRGTRVDICRVLLRHAVFGDRVLQAVCVTFQQMGPWGQGGGFTKCKWISNEEAKTPPPMRSLWLDLKLSSPPPE